jgi:hypothetical protein
MGDAHRTLKQQQDAAAADLRPATLPPLASIFLHALVLETKGGFVKDTVNDLPLQMLVNLVCLQQPGPGCQRMWTVWINSGPPNKGDVV